MVRVLSVAEKPSVAKEVAKILSRGTAQQQRGVSMFNANHNFDYDFGPGSGWGKAQMVVTSVTGHLMNTEFDEKYTGWYSCDPVKLFFEAPVYKFVPEDKKDIQTNLEQEARRSNVLMLWLDCDREGENIGYEVIEVCLGANPNLTVKRARFSALIPNDIHHAVMNAGPPDRLASEAVDARSEIDLRLGAAFTRFQTMMMQGRFETDGVVSFGGCQFPTLRFVVEREREIEAFREEPFWKIEMEHTRTDPRSGERSHAIFLWERGRVFDRLTCLVLYELCAETPTATVLNVNKRQTNRSKPVPLATVEFQREASTKLRIASDKTMSVAESLYQRGFLSYPRTETDKFKEVCV
ncbi:DNA topoisomerase [Pavlovales sp. CCMP2436]|nr:DNA topoisomerase [Pavlovales sp. CCMP2436]